jgi:hypothetical protein
MVVVQERVSFLISAMRKVVLYQVPWVEARAAYQKPQNVRVEQGCSQQYSSSLPFLVFLHAVMFSTEGNCPDLAAPGQVFSSFEKLDADFQPSPN